MPLGLTPFQGSLLANASGQLVGAIGLDGKEYLIPTLNNTAAAVATVGAVNGVSVGATTPGTGSFTACRTTSMQSVFTDGSGTPGNVTQNNISRGRAAFAAAGSSVTVTSNLTAATSTVIVVLGGADVTLKSVTVTPGAGSFTVTGNAAATGTTPFDWFLIGN